MTSDIWNACFLLFPAALSFQVSSFIPDLAFCFSLMELLYERQAKVLGLVFNRADTKSRSYRYYKYAKYYHSEKTA